MKKMKDIDECEGGENETSICHEKAECVNIPGSFECNCLKGYTEIGQSCICILLFPLFLFSSLILLPNWIDISWRLRKKERKKETK